MKNKNKAQPAHFTNGRDILFLGNYFLTHCHDTADPQLTLIHTVTLDIDHNWWAKFTQPINNLPQLTIKPIAQFNNNIWFNRFSVSWLRVSQVFFYWIVFKVIRMKQ